MALDSAKRHVRVRGLWPVSATHAPSSILGAYSQGTPTITATTGGSGVVYASSPRSVDINAAITAANNGDTVYVPPGAETWTADVTIPSTKGVKLIGAGQGLTNINLGGTYRLFLDTRSTNAAVRASGFTFTNGPAHSLRINNMTLGATNWRVDHCTWSGITSANCTAVTGYTFGVFDHCTWTNCFRPLWIEGQNAAYDIAGYPGPINYPGAYSWTQPLDWGGPSAVYYEDCTFSTTTRDILFNCRAGARFVFRHNTVTGSNMETHSGCTPGMRNDRWCEIYENAWDYTGGSVGMGVWLRGMNGAIYNNTFVNGYQSSVQFDYEQACRPSAAVDWINSCNPAWLPAFDVNPPHDRINIDYYTYPVQDQIGCGRDTGWGTAQAADEAKLWIWSNTLNGSASSPVFVGCAEAAEFIQSGRDYFTSAPAGYTAYTYPHPVTLL